jgi:hypothetical protein
MICVISELPNIMSLTNAKKLVYDASTLLAEKSFRALMLSAKHPIIPLFSLPRSIISAAVERLSSSQSVKAAIRMGETAESIIGYVFDLLKIFSSPCFGVFIDRMRVEWSLKSDISKF